MAKSSWRETVELVGILAIVASLIALVMELRQTQSALSAQTYQARAIDALGEALCIADSEYLVPIVLRQLPKKCHKVGPRLATYWFDRRSGKVS